MHAKKLDIDEYIEDAIRNLHTKDVKITADSYAVGQAVSHIDTMHKKDDGYITTAVKRGSVWHQYHYKSCELKENIGKLLSIDDINLYVSPNSFYKPFRKIENVRKLNSLYIDIDYYALGKLKKLSPDEIIYLLEEKYFNKYVPQASIIVITGRGIAVY